MLCNKLQKTQKQKRFKKQMTYGNIKIFVYIYMFQKYPVIIKEIFVFVVGQADFLLDEVISASPHDASFLAHVSL